MRRALRRDDTGNEPHAGVDERQGRNFAAGEHEVAQRDLPGVDQIEQAVIDALVVAADDDQPLQPAQPLGGALIEALARGRRHDDALA